MKRVTLIVRQNEISRVFPNGFQPLLKDCGLVNDRKEGNRRLYSITDPRIFEAIDAVTPELVKTLSAQILEKIA